MHFIKQKTMHILMPLVLSRFIIIGKAVFTNIQLTFAYNIKTQFCPTPRSPPIVKLWDIDKSLPLQQPRFLRKRYFCQMAVTPSLTATLSRCRSSLTGLKEQEVIFRAKNKNN